jgi:small subunit ribosomal protein S20
LANIKSQIKRNHQNEKRRLRNRDYRGSARTAVKDARAALTGGQDSQASVMAAISALDKAAQKGAIHPRNAARRKGRLMKQLAALGMPSHAAAVEQAPAAEKGAKKKAAKEAMAAEQAARQAEPKKTAAKTEKKAVEKKPAAKKTAKK